MKRNQIISVIGDKYFESNIENGEWSYVKALKSVGKTIDNHLVTNVKTGTKHKDLDLRFVDSKCRISILVETKQDFNKDFRAAKSQLQAYVEYEKVLTGNTIIAILANTSDDQIAVWKDSVSDATKLIGEFVLKSFDEYRMVIFPVKNDKEEVMRHTYELNELMHRYGINEKLRSQFVGTCLLALKRNTKYEGLRTSQIIAGFREVLSDLLSDNINKAEKLVILDKSVLGNQSIKNLPDAYMQSLLSFISHNILPYINDKSTMGQDLLNLFFTIFNKYAGKSDKNQAFTPDHIVDFMSKVIGVNRNSRVLDPCCGSGAFLVRALTDAIDDCDNERQRREVRSKHIYGIEAQDNAFGLATTNMLIHSDGNSNIIKSSCFEENDWIENAHIDRVLMNPPYNATSQHCKREYVETWGPKVKSDPSKGFHFVYEIAKIVKTGKLAVLLPMKCAIGDDSEIDRYKRLMLQEHTLDAVFTLPAEMFYPGASVCACCMVFTLGEKHEKSHQNGTFFGYFKDDGFIKRKRIGRVEMIDPKTGKGVWKRIENEWLNLYRQRKSVVGLSAVRRVTAEDEWLCEAYMETPYDDLHRRHFEIVVRNYMAFQISSFSLFPSCVTSNMDSSDELIDCAKWKWFEIRKYFNVKKGKRLTAEDQVPGFTPYIGAIESNNGVSNYIGQAPRHRGNTISLSYNGSVGQAFYQPKDFWATDDVNVLYPLFDMNKWVALFLCGILRKECYRYCYGRKWKMELMKTTMIKLPAKNGEPDWGWMESYIKKLPFGDCV